MRIVNRLIAAAVGLALLVGGLLVTLEILLAALGQGPWLIPYDGWRSTLETYTWDSTDFRAWAAVLTGIGVVLLFVQLLRRLAATLPLKRSEGSVSAEISRPSLESALRRAAERVDGIDSAKVHVDRGVARVRAKTNRKIGSDLESDVTTTVRRRLAAMDLAQPPRVSVKVNRASTR